jgi:hypothetical protein
MRNFGERDWKKDKASTANEIEGERETKGERYEERQTL